MKSEAVFWTDANVESAEDHTQGGKSKRICVGLGVATECEHWSGATSQTEKWQSAHDLLLNRNSNDAMQLYPTNIGAAHNEHSRPDIQWPQSNSSIPDQWLDHNSFGRFDSWDQASHESVQNLIWPSPNTDNESQFLYPIMNATTQSQTVIAGIQASGNPSSAGSTQISSHISNSVGEASDNRLSSDIDLMEIVSADQDIESHHPDNQDTSASENMKFPVNLEPQKLERDICLGMVRPQEPLG